MSRQIFINLPVRDLSKATEFYAAIGAVRNPQFSDDTSSCMVLSDAIFVMLLTHEKWANFTKKTDYGLPAGKRGNAGAKRGGSWKCRQDD